MPAGGRIERQVTAPVKFVRVMFTVVWPLAPALTGTVVGVAESE